MMIRKLILLGNKSLVLFLVIPVTLLGCSKRNPVDATVVCLQNLFIVAGAKNLVAIDKGLTNGTPVTSVDIAPHITGGVDSKYLRCPKGGSYNLGLIGKPPACSLHGEYTERSARYFAPETKEYICAEPVARLQERTDLGLSREGCIVRITAGSTNMAVLKGFSLNEISLGSICPANISNITHLLGCIREKGLQDKLYICEVKQNNNQDIDLVLSDGIIIKIKKKQDAAAIKWTVDAIYRWLEYVEKALQTMRHQSNAIRTLSCNAPGDIRQSDLY